MTPRERWMMDAVQESYATASPALMAPGRYAPAPHADLVNRGMTQRFYILTFFFFFLHSLYSFSLPHSQWDSWIYSATSSLALCCAEQSILQPMGLLYKVLHQIQMTDARANHSRRSWSKMAHLGAHEGPAGVPWKMYTPTCDTVCF